MTRLLQQLRQLRASTKGASALEFALVAPVLLMLLMGITQLGVLFFAQAGLKSAVEDAARFATLWPTPNQSQIEQRIQTRRFGMDPANIVGPTVTFSANQAPNFVTISMGYRITLNYLFDKKTLVLSESRRAYVAN